MAKLDTRDTMVNWFCKAYPDLVQRMKETNHAFDPTDHPYHLEDSVWTHTLMVMTYIECRTFGQVLLTVGMLHDIGKCDSRTLGEKAGKGRYSFNGHEGLSTMYSIDILNSMEKEDNFYSNDIKKLILQLISLHGIDLNDGSLLCRQHRLFREADKFGAVRNVDENIFSQYGERKFSSRKEVQDDKTLILLSGLPGSGKSTLAESEFKDYFIISRDRELEKFYNIKHLFTDKYNKGDYNTKFNWVYDNEDRLNEFNQSFDKLLVYASKNYNKVVIDMTLLAMGKRRGILNIFKKHQANIILNLVGMDELKNINNLRGGKRTRDYKFNVMAQKFTVPIVDEGFNSVIINLRD